MKEEVPNIPLSVCLNSEKDREEKSAAHATQVEVEEATMQVVNDHQASYEIREHLSLLEADLLSAELKERAAVPHHASPEFFQQEALSQCVNTSVVDPTSLVPCSSVIFW